MNVLPLPDRPTQPISHRKRIGVTLIKLRPNFQLRSFFHSQNSPNHSEKQGHTNTTSFMKVDEVGHTKSVVVSAILSSEIVSSVRFFIRFLPFSAALGGQHLDPQGRHYS